MTTIYLTQWQYQQVLDGMISTHLDVLDHNHDGKITQLGDGQIAVQHRQTPSIACGSPRHYVYAATDIIDDDQDPDAYTDIQVIGLSHENDQALGYSSSELDFGGELYGYNLETLNKVIDYYNNGGSWNDDDFEKHVYEGIGATGQLAPESVRGTANIDGQMDNPIQNDQLLWNSYVCNSLEDMLALNGLEQSDMASYTTDDQGRIATITLTSGRTLWANYDLSSDGVSASFLTELQAAGATDIKYTDDGMIASYTINGTTYNVSDEFGETSTNDARTAELLALANEKRGNQEQIQALAAQEQENTEEIENKAASINQLSDEIKDDVENTKNEVNNYVKAQASQYEHAVQEAVNEAKNQNVKAGSAPKSINDILASKNLSKFDVSSEVATKAASTMANSSKISEIEVLTGDISALNDQNISLNTQISGLAERNFEIDAELSELSFDNMDTEFAQVDTNAFDLSTLADTDSVNEDIAKYSFSSVDLSNTLDETVAGLNNKKVEYNIHTQIYKESGKVDGEKAVKELSAEQ